MPLKWLVTGSSTTKNCNTTRKGISEKSSAPFPLKMSLRAALMASERRHVSYHVPTLGTIASSYFAVEYCLVYWLNEDTATVVNKNYK